MAEDAELVQEPRSTPRTISAGLRGKFDGGGELAA